MNVPRLLLLSLPLALPFAGAWIFVVVWNDTQIADKCRDAYWQAGSQDGGNRHAEARAAERACRERG